MPVRHELELIYKRSLLSLPLLNQICKTREVVLNLSRASVNHRQGHVIVSFSGSPPEVKAAEELLVSHGVEMRLLSDHMVTSKLADIPRCASVPQGEVEERKLWLTFGEEMVERPISWEMARRFDVFFDIREASIGHEGGIVGMLIQGTKKQLDDACTFLFANGVGIEPIEKGVVTAH